MSLIPEANREQLAALLRSVSTELLADLTTLLWDPQAYGVDRLIAGETVRIDKQQLCVCPLVGVLILRGHVTPEALREDPHIEVIASLDWAGLTSDLHPSGIDRNLRTADGEYLEGDPLRLVLSNLIAAAVIGRLDGAHTEPGVTVDDTAVAPPF